MADKGVIARNTLFLSLAHGASKLFSISLTAIAARVLGTVGYGYYSAGNAFIEVGRVFASSGLDYLVTREVATDPTQATRVASAAAGLKMVLASVAYLVLAALVYWLDYPTPVLHVVLILGTILFTENLSDTTDAVFMGRERMDFITRTLVVSSASIFLLAGAALLLGLGLDGFVAGIAVGCVVRTVVGRAFLRRQDYGRIVVGSIERAETVRLAQAALPLMGATVVTLLFHRVDIIMLSRLTEPAQWGLYGAAVRVIDVVLLAPRILAQAIYPTLRKATHESTEAAVALMNQGLRVTLVISSAISLMVWILSPLALRVIGGSEFLPAVSALRILAWAICLQGACHLMARLLFAIEGERDFLSIGWWGLVCNVGLNAWWIPRWGIDGAAWATLASYGFTLVLYVLYAARRGYRVSAFRSIFLPVVVVAAAASVPRLWSQGGALEVGGAMIAIWVVGIAALRVISFAEFRRGLQLLLSGGR